MTYTLWDERRLDDAYDARLDDYVSPNRRCESCEAEWTETFVSEDQDCPYCGEQLDLTGLIS